MKVVLGMPIFTGVPLLTDTVIVPAGQFNNAEAVRKKYGNWERQKTAQQVVHEYGVVAEALLSFGHEPFLLHDFRYVQKEIVDFFTEMGYKFLNLEIEDTGMLRFPRDAFTYLSENVLLVNTESTFEPIIQSTSSLRTIDSPFGEGGRVMLFGKKILCPEFFIFDGHKVELAEVFAEPIRDLGYEPVYVPNHLLMSNTYERGFHIEPDDHLDRVAGKVVDREGNFHLVVEPTLKVSMQEGFGKMLPSSKTGIDRWKRVLGNAGIKVHVPKECRVPMSCGFYQMPCGKIIVTSGDEALIDTLLGIVPVEDLVILNPTIEVFPSQMSAGVRCLINELPDSLVLPRIV